MSLTYEPGKRAQAVELTKEENEEFERIGVQSYQPDQGLVNAVNVALMLGQPLLLTGEPGTGKTHLAYSVAWCLGMAPPLKFETKSISVSRDLFYTYDALGRYQAQQSGLKTSPVDYFCYNALGTAIVLANQKQTVIEYLPSGFHHPGDPQKSIVLIDEVDKAPRDFPNDILNEIDGMYFRIPELGNPQLNTDQVSALRPIIIITSNSEKDLPDPFLRRCVYYDIPFPQLERMTEIVEARNGSFLNRDNPLMADALKLFYELRKPTSGMRKMPATAELLGWIQAICQASKHDNPFRDDQEKVKATMSALIKTKEDQELTEHIVSSWLNELGNK